MCGVNIWETRQYDGIKDIKDIYVIISRWDNRIIYSLLKDYPDIGYENRSIEINKSIWIKRNLYIFIYSYDDFKKYKKIRILRHIFSNDQCLGSLYSYQYTKTEILCIIICLPYFGWIYGNITMYKKLNYMVEKG